MRVVFKTNIDHYKTNCFPKNVTTPPRIGEKVLVNDVFFDYYTHKKLPTKLEVVDVLYSQHGVVCELWYTKIDIETANLRGIKLL